MSASAQSSHIWSRILLVPTTVLTLMTLALVLSSEAASAATRRTCETAFKEDRTLPVLSQNPTSMAVPQELPSRFAKRVAPLHVEAKMWEYAEFRERLKELRVTLSQSERSLIFYVLVDHPRLLFGELGAKLLDLRGVHHHQDRDGKSFISDGAIFDMKQQIEYLPKSEEHKRLEGWKSIDNPTYFYDRTVLSRKILSILSAIATYDGQPKSAVIEGSFPSIKIQLALTKADLLKVVREAKPLTLPNFNPTVDKTIPKDYDFRGYTEFGDFFRWLNADRDRKKYAELVLFHSFIPWLTVATNSEFSAKEVLDENQIRVLRQDAEPRLARRGLSLMSARKRYLESIRNSKLDMGAALYAFPIQASAEPLSNETQALYTVQSPKLAIEFATILDQADVDVFAIDHASATRSAQKMALAITRASLALSAISKEAQRVTGASESYFASLRMTAFSPTEIEAHLQKLEEFQNASDLLAEERTQMPRFVDSVLFKASEALRALETLSKETALSTLDGAQVKDLMETKESLQLAIQKLNDLKAQTAAQLSQAESRLSSKTNASQRLLLSEIK